ncbi:hypothetical protein FA13DRAFT_1725397 [Coprinellus micaceus]|uniref:CFEM domain-containing protein n=1 Tax=Coprinellus micaceus TaxID=71717 RepID=A0A4Y7TUY3_COPMI|nr:hypothetical protein FA13DRAFT_1725397 [Coprinellus micaceus]
MKTFTALLTLALLAITGAQAQFSDLPQCGSSCAQLSTSKATACTSSDIKCLCSSEDYVNAMYDCLAGACTFGDQSSTIGRMNEICAAAASTPDASSTPPATSSTPAAPSTGASSSSSAAAPAPTTSSTPVVVFTRTAGALTETSSNGAGTTTSGAGTRASGTTTVPPGATTTPSQSTTVVVRTVGGEETGSAGGSNILDGNGASSVRASGMVAGIAGVLAVVALL